MNANDMKRIIEDRYPKGLRFIGVDPLDVDLESKRSTRILEHYAARPQLNGRAIDLAIEDLTGSNLHSDSRTRKKP